MAKQLAQFESIGSPEDIDMDGLMRIYQLIFGTSGKINGVPMKECHCIMKKYGLTGKVKYERLRKKKDILPFLEENWGFKGFDLYIGRESYINGAVHFNMTTHFSCKNICIDIDDHGADPEEALHEVNAFLEDLQLQRRKHKIPMPNTVVYTGHGIQLWYHLHGTSAKRHIISKLTAEALCKQFQTFIDASPVAYADLEVDLAASARRCGLSRLPGSYNTKAQCFTQGIILSTRKWDLDDLKAKAGVPDKPEKKKRGKTGSRGKTGRRDNRSRYAALILRVLSEAAESGDYRSREVLCHVFHSKLLVLGVSQSEAEAAVREFNLLFKESLPDREINDLVRCDNSHYYRYSDKRMFSYAGVSCERAERYSLEKKCISEPRDYRRENAKRDRRRLEERIAWHNEIRELRQQGLSISAISRKTGRCRDTVAKYADTPMEDVGQALEALSHAPAEAKEKPKPAAEPEPMPEIDRKRRAVQLYKRGFRSVKIAKIMEITVEQAEEFLSEYKQYRKNRGSVRYAQYQVSMFGKRVASYLQEGYGKLADMDKAGVKGRRRQRMAKLVNRLCDIETKKKDLAYRLRNINPKSEDQMGILPVVLSEFSGLQDRFLRWRMMWGAGLWT
ncbi:MAG: hypothetical protein LIO80_02870 [Lachnospiraceae bacterium]|nr:hypothetical protein [Lachnospiraceae bacterium]